MRLIDSDAFKDWLLNCFAKSQDTLVLTLQGFIAEQPTAYDIDKVVEKLEKQRDIIFQNTDSEIRTVRANAWDKIDILNKAIEIVKHGSDETEPKTIRDKAIQRAKFVVKEVAEEYKNGWIPCSERLPEEHETMFAKLKGIDKWDSAMPEKISDDVNVTVEFEDGTRKTKTMHTIDGKWKTDINIVKFNVIAWRPLPEPYQQKGE